MTGPSQQQALSDPARDPAATPSPDGKFVVVNLDRSNNGEGSDVKKNPKYGSPGDDVELGPKSEPPKHDDDDATEGETVCRVCHLGLTTGTSNGNSNGNGTGNSGNGESIVLGCACKQDLALCHRDCAEEWFKIRGNTVCEICGETAKNVHILVESSSSARASASAATSGAAASATSASAGAVRVDGGGGIGGEARATIMSRLRYLWANQLVRNSLLATVIIVFMVPWFFRIAYF